MVHDSIKSPLVLSIGGVGLLAAGVIAVSYFRHHQQSAQLNQPPAAQIDDDATATTSPTATDPWERAKEYGWNAAVAAQTAQTEAEWRQVGDLWLLAVAELEQVPDGSPNKSQAQAKIQEYLANFEAADAKKTAARTAGSSAGLPFSRQAMQSAFGKGELEFSFRETVVTGGQNAVEGEAPDGSASITISGPTEAPTLATLRLEQLPADQSPTMAQLVYANRFLTVAAPDWALKNHWLATGLSQLKDRPQQPITVTHGTTQFTLKTEPDTGNVAMTAEKAQ